MAITFVRKTWTDQIINRLGRTISHTPVTKTTDPITGDETLTTGSPSNYTAVFLRRNTKWMFDKDGLIEGGDAYVIFDPADVTPSKNDIITADSIKYRIDNVITRYSDNNQSTAIHHYCNLFLIDDA